ncbi:MAG: hypothetical protein ABI835_10790 [Chloroflexota bacterium]
MSETGSNFLSDMARRVADSDAKADAELADILAGRPYKKRPTAPKAAADGSVPEKKAPAPRKPRAKRAPKKPVDE